MLNKQPTTYINFKCAVFKLFPSLILLVKLAMINIAKLTQKPKPPCAQRRLLVMFPEGLGDTVIFSEMIAKILKPIECPIDIVIKSEINDIVQDMGQSRVYFYDQLSDLKLEEFSQVFFFNPNLKPQYDGFISSFKGQVDRYFMLPAPLTKYRAAITKSLRPWTCHFIDDINKTSESPIYPRKVQNEKNTWLISTHSSLKDKRLSMNFVDEIIRLAEKNKKQVYLLTDYKSYESKMVTVSPTLDLLTCATLLTQCEMFCGIDSFISHLAKRYISHIYIVGELGNRSTYRYHDVNYFGSAVTCHDCMWLCHKQKRFECINVQEQELLAFLETKLGHVID